MQTEQNQQKGEQELQVVGPANYCAGKAVVADRMGSLCTVTQPLLLPKRAESARATARLEAGSSPDTCNTRDPQWLS